MKATVLTDTERIEVRDRPRPNPGPDEVVVRVGACGVCKTDYHIYRGSFAVDHPLVLGHESAGEVVETGEEVTDVDAGDRVAVNPAIPCYRCSACKAGRTNLCSNFTAIGGAGDEIIDGSFAEYLSVPAGNVESIGDLPMRHAAFAEPLGCCVHGASVADYESGDTVAILGAGPIGQLLTQVFRTTGAGTIVVSEPIDERRALARESGADHVVDPSADDPMETIGKLVGSVDVAVEAIGTAETIEQAHEVTSRGGTTLVFGVPPTDATITVNPFDVYYRELTITGSYSLTPRAFETAVTMLRTGRVEVEPLITEEFDLDRLDVALDMMGDGEGMKKLIVPNRGEEENIR